MQVLRSIGRRTGFESVSSGGRLRLLELVLEVGHRTQALDHDVDAEVLVFADQKARERPHLDPLQLADRAANQVTERVEREERLLRDESATAT